MPLRADGGMGRRQPLQRWWLVGPVALAALVLLLAALVVLPTGMPVGEQIGAYRVCGIWGTDAELTPPHGGVYRWEFGSALYARPGVHSVILPVRSGYADREWTLRFGRLCWAIVHFPEE